MATEIKVPELGEGADSADVVRVMVSPGDTIEKDQSIIEVESDKASVEVPSSGAGRVAEIRVSEGDTVTVGQVILTLESSAGEEQPAEPADSAGPGTSDASPAPHPAPARPAADGGDSTRVFSLPNLGEGADEGDVVGVLVSVGDRIAKGQSVIEIESDKASVEVPSEVEGEVVEIAVSVGDTVSVGQAILTVAHGGGESAAGRASAAAASSAPAAETRPDPSSGPGPSPAVAAPSPSDDGGRRPPLFAAPSVRTKARELGVDLRAVPGSGPAGRITKDDVDRYAAGGTARPTTSASAAASEAVTRSEAEAPARREKMSGIRKTVAQRMTQSWQTIPHVTLYREADATELEAVRQRFKGRAEARGTKLTVTAILVKICAQALRRFPQANSRVDMDTLEIEHPEDIHVGVAADTERGLVVPVVRDVPRLGIFEIAEQLASLAEKARTGKLSRGEMAGATFSLSNLGGLGIGFFTPIINPPEVAILGVGRAKEDGRGRLMIPLSMSIDHRALDGADGARVLKWIAEAIEDPMTLAFEA